MLCDTCISVIKRTDLNGVVFHACSLDGWKIVSLKECSKFEVPNDNPIQSSNNQATTFEDAKGMGITVDPEIVPEKKKPGRPVGWRKR
jgi:hypothetical protein